MRLKYPTVPQRPRIHYKGKRSSHTLTALLLPPGQHNTMQRGLPAASVSSSRRREHRGIKQPPSMRVALWETLFWFCSVVTAGEHMGTTTGNLTMMGRGF